MLAKRRTVLAGLTDAGKRESTVACALEISLRCWAAMVAASLASGANATRTPTITRTEPFFCAALLNSCKPARSAGDDSAAGPMPAGSPSSIRSVAEALAADRAKPASDTTKVRRRLLKIFHEFFMGSSFYLFRKVRPSQCLARF